MKKFLIPLVFCFSTSLFNGFITNIYAETSPYVALYQEICTIVRDNFYQPAVIEEVFPGIEKKYMAKVEKVSTKEAFSNVINEMLGELKTSHTYYLTPSDYEYYHLGAVFSKVPAIAKVFDNEEVQYPSVGIITTEVDGKHFVAAVLAGSVAEKAGLRYGDEIRAVNGAPYKPVKSIEQHVGKDVIFSIKRSQKKKVKKITVRPVLINPKKEMLDAERASVRIIEKEEKKIGYIHIYSYAGREYHEALVMAITWGKLKHADALIIDLREGLGGASPDYLNIFNPNIPIFHMIDREGKKQICDSQWRKPAVYITNGATRSGKELLVFGAKKYKYATIIGEKTAGAATAGRLFPLSNNDFIYLAVSGCEIDGVVLEGEGVAPDIDVPVNIQSCQGQDLQLNQSIEYLLGVLNR